uniref:Uncharacterized protein n=1 Tax=Anguilla anguilla TaxID=7936 RepID=A0A0E9U5A2_ANGAN
MCIDFRRHHSKPVKH